MRTEDVVSKDQLVVFVGVRGLAADPEVVKLESGRKRERESRD